LLAFDFLGDLVVADLVFLAIVFFGPVVAAFFVGTLAFVVAAFFVLVAVGATAFLTVFFCAERTHRTKSTRKNQERRDRSRRALDKCPWTTQSGQMGQTSLVKAAPKWTG